MLVVVRELVGEKDVVVVVRTTLVIVTARFSLDLFYYLFMCVYMCLYVINCLCVYFELGLLDFGVRMVLWSF